MQKITPNLWFDKEAKEAAHFYVSAFGKDSKVKEVMIIPDTPSGDCDFLVFELWGYEFMAISAGPLFKINPSISFMVYCNSKKEVDRLWRILSHGGKVLMPLDTYPWSERYGWMQDTYGVSWQLILRKGSTREIVPKLMYTGKQAGKAEEAIDFYMKVFKKTNKGDVMRYGKGQEPDKEGTLAHASFKLEGQEFNAMDSAREHAFSFNEAVSLLVHCKDQKEIDYYWEKLSSDPAAEQCGWLKDKYGVSWQVSPMAMSTMLRDPDQKKVSRVIKAFLQMKKFDLKTLEKAYEGK